MKKTIRLLLWCLPWLLQSGSAHAWGLYTHVFIAQWLLWGAPLLDTELRRAVSRYPKLVMAGACMPDLALVGSWVGTQAFERTHCWHNAAEMLAGTQNDEERALMVGFYSHLFADVVAHHHFVPAHELMWGDWPIVVHAISEWSMDAHIRHQVSCSPRELLRSNEAVIVRLLSHHFEITEHQARRAVRLLAQADGVLRGMQLPQWLYRMAIRFDHRIERRFDYFIGQTSTRFTEFNRVLSGELPQPDANGGCAQVAQVRLEQYSYHQIKLGQPLPQDCYFSPVKIEIG